MRALVASSTGEEHIQLREVPDPAPAPNETVVRVKAISLNRGEVNRLASAEDGARLGWDLAGVVERPAENGQGLPAGTRVVAFVRAAGWAELVAVPNLQAAALPDGVSFAAAATLPVAGLTALRMLRHGGLLLGKRVLVTGASGGVGRFALQLGADAGANLTAVSRDSGRAEGLERLGAAAIVHNLEPTGDPFDLILESVGGSSLAASIQRLAPGGTLVTFGNSSREETTFNISTFYGKDGARILAFSLLALSQPADFRPDLRFLAEEVRAGKLDPQIDLETTWQEAARALAALRERRVKGKAVLIIGQG